MSNYSIKKVLLQLLDLPIEVLKRFQRDRLNRHAAALAYSSLLALAPMLAIAFLMLSMVPSFAELSSSLEEFIVQFLVPAAGEDLRQLIEQFAGQAGKLTFVGVLFFMLTALLLLFNIENSFNDIWGVGQGRTPTNRLTVYWALLSLGPVLMGASLVISTNLLSLTAAAGAEIGVQVKPLGNLVLPILFEMLAFLLLYLIMPNVRVSLKHALAGAIVASILFEVSKRLFGLYIMKLSNFELVYGALSTLPIFLVWVYFSWGIALIGAEVVAVLQERTASNDQQASGELVQPDNGE
jgi:membrane protein